MNDALQQLISSGENRSVEFKQSFGKDAIETITAFSSEQGAFSVTLRLEPQKTTQKIVEALRIHPTAGRAELAKIVGDITEDGVKYHLTKLKKQGVIRRVGPDKGGCWEILSVENSE